MRADRLVAALLVLQARGRVTARELAVELEVSEKTARRDLEALGMAGFPVYAQPGRTGGWQLLGGARTDLSGLTAAETRALFLLAGASPTIGPDARAALRKLVRALPETFRAEAEAAATAVVVDRPTWGEGSRPAPAFLADLQRAVIERRQVVLGYRDRTQQSSERIIDPLGLVSKGAVWYLVADTDAGRRTFRVGRVTGVEVTDRPARRPDGFDLAEAWSAVVSQVHELRTQVRATVRIPAGFVGALRGRFGDDMSLTEVAGASPDGTVEVLIGGPSPIVIAEHLAGWGSVLEVLDPPEVRDELRQIAADLRSLYG